MNTLAGRLFSICVVTILLSSCTTLGPGYEQPTVTLASFKAIPSEGMVPAFEIGLRVINPNPSDLNLAGIVYTISLEGYELVKGVGKGYPVIEGYSEQVVMLTASANLLAGIRFIGDMMGRQDEQLDYEFQAKLDLGGLYPSLHVEEAGQFSLAGSNRIQQ